MNWNDVDGAEWTYVSRKLIPARLIAWWIFLGLLAVMTILLAVFVSPWLWVPTGIFVLLGLWVSWLVYRQVTAIAWIERDDDLVIKKGRIFRSLTVVPYGRMQYVEVEQGPISRAYKFASVQLHTASPGTDASIPGVPADEAAALRERLMSRGEARRAGL